MAEKVILFDGVCNLCNKSVQFIIKRDKKKQFRFASLQGNFGQKVLREHHMDTTNLQSILLLDGQLLYKQSTAALKISKNLPGLWPLFYGFMLVPVFIRDGIYNWIAKNRYRWFGKKESCWLPTAGLKERFLN